METQKIDVIKIAKEMGKISGVAAICLFGSRAKGTERPYSDYDLCVITKPKISAKTKDKILSYSSKIIDTHILADLPLYLQFRVLKEAKLLHINSEKDFLETRLQVIRKYQDFRPRLERYYRNILAETKLA